MSDLPIDPNEMIQDLITLYGEASVRLSVLEELMIEKGWVTREQLAEKFARVAVQKHDERKTEAQRRAFESHLRNRRKQ